MPDCKRSRWGERGRAARYGSWALELFGVARSVASTAGSLPRCDPDAAPITLPQGYPTRAQAAAALQLERAGVRLALELTRALS